MWQWFAVGFLVSFYYFATGKRILRFILCPRFFLWARRVYFMPRWIYAFRGMQMCILAWTLAFFIDIPSFISNKRYNRYWTSVPSKKTSPLAHSAIFLLSWFLVGLNRVLSGKHWLLSELKYVYHLTRSDGKMHRFHHRGTHWQAALFY